MDKKKWIIILMLFLLLPIKAKASNHGSIRLTMKNGSNAVSGGSIILYEISEWNCGENEEPADLASFAALMGMEGTEKTVDKSGCVCFENLEPGQYLLVQKEVAEGYYPMLPFLVTLPTVINGDRINDINAEPKLERIPEAQLPQTGQLHWPVWLMTGTGILLLGVGRLLQKKE